MCNLHQLINKVFYIYLFILLHIIRMLLFILNFIVVEKGKKKILYLKGVFFSNNEVLYFKNRVSFCLTSLRRFIPHLNTFSCGITRVACKQSPSYSLPCLKSSWWNYKNAPHSSFEFTNTPFTCTRCLLPTRVLPCLLNLRVDNTYFAFLKLNNNKISLKFPTQTRSLL